MKIFMIILFSFSLVFGAGGPYSPYDDFSGVERHADFMGMTKVGLFESAGEIAQEEFLKLEERLDADDIQRVVPSQWIEFNAYYQSNLAHAKQVISFASSMMNGLIEQRGGVVENIKAGLLSGQREWVEEYAKTGLSGLDERINDAFFGYEKGHNTLQELMRERWEKAKELYPVLYARNIWNFEKEYNSIRSAVLLQFEDVELPTSNVVMEEHKIQGMNIAKEIYSYAGKEYDKASNSGCFEEIVASIKQSIQREIGVCEDYADRFKLCQIHESIDKFPILGVLDYQTLRLSMASPEERKTMISPRTILSVHKPMIDRFFEQLYPGAILYNIFVTRGMMPEGLFPDFLKELEENLGWRLPLGS